MSLGFDPDQLFGPRSGTAPAARALRASSHSPEMSSSWARCRWARESCADAGALRSDANGGPQVRRLRPSSGFYIKTEGSPGDEQGRVPPRTPTRRHREASRPSRASPAGAPRSIPSPRVSTVHAACFLHDGSAGSREMARAARVTASTARPWWTYKDPSAHRAASATISAAEPVSSCGPVTSPSRAVTASSQALRGRCIALVDREGFPARGCAAGSAGRPSRARAARRRAPSALSASSRRIAISRRRSCWSWRGAERPGP